MADGAKCANITAEATNAQAKTWRVELLRNVERLEVTMLGFVMAGFAMIYCWLRISEDNEETTILATGVRVQWRQTIEIDAACELFFLYAIRYGLDRINARHRSALSRNCVFSREYRPLPL